MDTPLVVHAVSLLLPLAALAVSRYHLKRHLHFKSIKRFSGAFFDLLLFLVGGGSLALALSIQLYGEYALLIYGIETSGQDVMGIFAFAFYAVIIGAVVGVSFGARGDDGVRKGMTKVRDALSHIIQPLVVLALLSQLVFHLTDIAEYSSIVVLMVETPFTYFFLGYLYGYVAYWILYKRIDLDTLQRHLNK